MKNLKNKVVYLSSKMSGLKDFGHNNFEIKAKELKNKGVKKVINPNTLGKKYGYKEDHSFYMKKSLGLLLKADTLYLFGNWKKSKGARLEHRVAKALKLNIVKEK